MTRSLRLEAMINIDERIAGWLREVGVEDQVDLRDLGSIEAFRRLQVQTPEVCDLPLLQALQGALMDIDAADLPDRVRRRLQREFQGELR